MQLLLIALSNVLRRRRQTLRYIIAIAFPVSIFVAGWSIAEGVGGSMEYQLLSSRAGNVVLYAKNYLQAARRQPVQESLEESWGLARQAESVPGVMAVAPRIRFTAMHGVKERSLPIRIQGVEPLAEERFGRFPGKIVVGVRLDGPGQILLDSTSADLLDVLPTQTVSLTAGGRVSDDL